MEESLATTGRRFAFGKNWHLYLELVDESRIRLAEESLCTMLEVQDLKNRSFLDIGSGSGLFSLAARRLGATVHSFDFDPDSVLCARRLKERFRPGDGGWQIERGDVLDRDYMAGLGTYDTVYSWGVLHHTGGMWTALEQAALAVAPGGALFIAIYNDQGRASRRWLRVKRAYNRLPSRLRFLVLIPALLRLWGPTFIRDLLNGHPLRTWRGYRSARGMSPWRDVVDWVGGYPFEVACPDAVFDFFKARGFTLSRLKTCGGGIGCNEFVFRKALGAG